MKVDQIFHQLEPVDTLAAATRGVQACGIAAGVRKRDLPTRMCVAALPAGQRGRECLDLPKHVSLI